MMQEVRAAWLLQRLKYGSAAVSWRDALRWGTAGSAALLGRDALGRIAPGMAADLALFRLDERVSAGPGIRWRRWWSVARTGPRRSWLPANGG